MIVQLGEWAPDGAEIGPGRLLIASGCVPGPNGAYRPIAAPVETSDALSETPLGMAAFRDQASAVHRYAGGSATLQEQNSDGTWTDRSRGSGYGPATDSTRWRFAQYGDRCVAANGFDPLQYIDMSSGSAFDDLPGDPPAAKFVAAVNQFVVTANDDVSAYRVAWSAIGDSETWTNDGSNQAGAEILADGGQITGLASTEVAFVFQEFGIRRMQWVGGDVIFQFDVVERERGCIAPGSLAQVGRAFFFLAEDGFYVFDDAGGARAIGDKRVDSWFKTNASRADYHRMTSAIDPIRKLYCVLFTSAGSANGQPDTLLMYNWSVDRWSYATIDAEIIGPVVSPGLTLEDLDAIYGNLDAIPLSLDDPSLAGGAITLGGMNNDGHAISFAGDNLEAVFVTSDFLGGDAALMFARSVRPFVSAACYASIGARMAPSDAVSYSIESLNSARGGLAPLRKTGRYLRAKLRVPAAETWSQLEGFEIDLVSAGAV